MDLSPGFRLPGLGKVRLVVSFKNAELPGTYAVLVRPVLALAGQPTGGKPPQCSYSPPTATAQWRYCVTPPSGGGYGHSAPVSGLHHASHRVPKVMCSLHPPMPSNRRWGVARSGRRLVTPYTTAIRSCAVFGVITCRPTSHTCARPGQSLSPTNPALVRRWHCRSGRHTPWHSTPGRA